MGIILKHFKIVKDWCMNYFSELNTWSNHETEELAYKVVAFVQRSPFLLEALMIKFVTVFGRSTLKVLIFAGTNFRGNLFSREFIFAIRIFDDFARTYLHKFRDLSAVSTSIFA